MVMESKHKQLHDKFQSETKHDSAALKAQREKDAKLKEINTPAQKKANINKLFNSILEKVEEEAEQRRLKKENQPEKEKAAKEKAEKKEKEKKV